MMNSPRLAVAREGVDSAPWSARGLRLSVARSAELAELLASVRDVVYGGGLPFPLVLDYATAQRTLDGAWHAVAEALQLATSDPSGSSRVPVLVDLLRQLKMAGDRIQKEQVRHREMTFEKVRAAMSLLRDVDSTAALIEQVPLATCTLGFDRALLSRVEDSLWIPEAMHARIDPEWAKDVVAIGREHPQEINGSLVEAEMVRRAVSILVQDAQDHPRVNRPLREATRSRSYAGAPVLVHGNAVGFLHVDCYHQQRNLDDTDRNLLAMFAEGVGQCLSRTLVLDRLASIRAEVNHISSALTTSESTWPTGGGTSQGSADQRGGTVAAARTEPAFASRAGEHALTARELDVLRLIARGDTNARIARRLVISEGTVKSHVKHILRKLGASNRAEAVSHGLRMERESSPRVGTGRAG